MTAQNDLQGVRLRETVMEEGTLIAGYGGIRRPSVVPIPRVEMCACGGEPIYVDVQSTAVITAAVRRHQDTEHHRGWSERVYGR